MGDGFAVSEAGWHADSSMNRAANNTISGADGQSMCFHGLILSFDKFMDSSDRGKKLALRSMILTMDDDEWNILFRIKRKLIPAKVRRVLG